MISDSITNASATSAPHSRDFGKKKRTNRSAKLKQCKLDARREQWLSQATAKNKRCEEETVNDHKSAREKLTERDHPFVNLDTEHREEDKEGTFHHGSHIETSPNSPSGSSTLGGTASSTIFSGSSSRSSSSSGSGSGGYCSGNITEEEEGDDDNDGCLEDWEAFADALVADEKQEHHNSPPELEQVVQSATLKDLHDESGATKGSGVCVNNINLDCQRIRVRTQLKKAWRPDDELRPQTLPNLAKHNSFPATDRRFGSTAVQSPCPICCEELDLTDSNFLPCPCGFQLCLFCHKTICDGDGRCPACRKPYDQNAIETETSIHGGGLIIRLARSCSMGYSP